MPTSFAFIAAMMPLVLSAGAGAEMRQSLGTAVFFGMIGVTLVGIFLTPVFRDAPGVAIIRSGHADRRRLAGHASDRRLPARVRNR